MKKYKVTPIRNGVKAPYIMVEVPSGKTEETEAVKVAKSFSGLSRFESWKFQAESLN